MVGPTESRITVGKPADRNADRIGSLRLPGILLIPAETRQHQPRISADLFTYLKHIEILVLPPAVTVARVRRQGASLRHRRLLSPLRGHADDVVVSSAHRELEEIS